MTTAAILAVCVVLGLTIYRTTRPALRALGLI